MRLRHRAPPKPSQGCRQSSLEIRESYLSNTHGTHPLLDVNLFVTAPKRVVAGVNRDTLHRVIIAHLDATGFERPHTKLIYQFETTWKGIEQTIRECAHATVLSHLSTSRCTAKRKRTAIPPMCLLEINIIRTSEIGHAIPVRTCNCDCQSRSSAAGFHTPSPTTR
jgi:hypothetical protein